MSGVVLGVVLGVVSGVVSGVVLGVVSGVVLADAGSVAGAVANVPGGSLELLSLEHAAIVMISAIPSVVNHDALE